MQQFAILSSLKNWLSALSLRLILGILLNALLLHSIIYVTYPVANFDWNKAQLLYVLIFFGFVPLVTLAWGIFSPASWSKQTFILQSVILLHAFAALCFGLAAWLNIFSKAQADPLVAILAVGLAVFLDIALFAMAPTKKATPTQISAYKKGIVIIGGGSLVALFGWSYANIGIVAWQAERHAYGNPYCIEVATNDLTTQEITNLFQLSGLKLRAPALAPAGAATTTYMHAFHAILVIDGPSGREEKNWTYYGQTFEPITDKARRSKAIPRTHCEPKMNFFRQVSMW